MMVSLDRVLAHYALQHRHLARSPRVVAPVQGLECSFCRFGEALDRLGFFPVRLGVDPDQFIEAMDRFSNFLDHE